jgi:hypothetical protein
MKRAVSILMIVVFSLHFAGFYAYYAFRLVDIRKEMRKELKQKPLYELQKLTLSIEEYTRSKVGDDEVNVGGKMYDIARMEAFNNEIVIYALHDEAEDSLISLLNTIIKRGDDDKRPVPQSLLALLGLHYLPSVFHLINHVLLNSKASTHYLVSIYSFYPNLLSPPPRQ